MDTRFSDSSKLIPVFNAKKDFELCWIFKLFLKSMVFICRISLENTVRQTIMVTLAQNTGTILEK